MLPKSHRLRRTGDFSKVYRLGRKAMSDHLVVRVWEALSPESAPCPEAAPPGELASAQPPQRVGIVVSLKVSKRAVVRNRLKRQIRAIMAQWLPQLSPHLWIVINLRPGAEQCEYGDFLQELKQLFTQLEVFHGHS
ncbi:MAG: ribonuclease P protein component [Leptolyngbya sp.]|nr:ribonuclease P protein component [Leptolyngbya sp.]